jgi:hypothetical protein
MHLKLAVTVAQAINAIVTFVQLIFVFCVQLIPIVLAVLMAHTATLQPGCVLQSNLTVQKIVIVVVVFVHWKQQVVQVLMFALLARSLDILVITMVIVVIVIAIQI